MKRKLVFFIAGLLTVLLCSFFLMKDNLYSNRVLQVRLVDEDYDCDIERSLYIIDSVLNNAGDSKKLINNFILPVFDSKNSYLYKTIYSNTHDSDNVKKRKAVIVVEGNLAIFSNVEDWYGCTGSKKMKIRKVISIKYVAP